MVADWFFTFCIACIIMLSNTVIQYSNYQYKYLKDLY